MNVTYSPDAPATSDFNIIDTALALWNAGQDIATSSMLLIAAFRVLVKRGIIPPYTGIVFLYAGYVIKVDSRGEANQYPVGWCDVVADLYAELV